MQQYLARCSVLVLVLGYAAQASAFDFSTYFHDHAQIAGKRLWTLGDFSHFKRKAYHDKDPKTGAAVTWNGLLLSEFVQKSLESLAPEQQAAVDLLVLKSRDGKQAFMPRYIADKYPILLTVQEDQNARLGSAVPSSTASRVRSERLPIEQYFIQDLAGIEFTNFQSAFGPYFLKKRSDPKSIRGERIVVQKCSSCHGAGMQTTGENPHGQLKGAPVRFLAGGEDAAAKNHPRVPGYIEPVEDEKKAILSYINARKLEGVREAKN